VSNTLSSSVVQRIQQSALLFIVLIFALGALILAATNINPSTANRGSIPYTEWSSPDGAITLEYASDWTVQTSPTNPLDFAFLPNPKDAVNSGLVTLVTLKVPAGQDLQTTMAGFLDSISNSQHPDAPLHADSALVGGLPGISTYWTVTTSDPSGAGSTEFDYLWFAPLDDSHFIISSFQTQILGTDVVEWVHTISTLHINKDLALKALGVTPTPEATATSAATASSTESATAQGAANATPAATQIATQAATS